MPLAPIDNSIEPKLREIAASLLTAADAIRELRQLGIFQSAAALPTHAIAPTASLDLSKLSGVEAMCQVLMETNGEPLKKDEILDRMKARGKAIGKGTLEAYLSTEKALFRSCGNGFWGLVDKAYSGKEGNDQR